jgi:mono/diheme cytochrome c family protein
MCAVQQTALTFFFTIRKSSCGTNGPLSPVAGPAPIIPKSALLKRLLLRILGLLILTGISIIALSWYFALVPVSPPAEDAFSPQIIAQGQMLAGIGNCAACHTVKGGNSLAGGLGMETPFGKLYSTNITPDPSTGIGSYSQVAFKRAMTQGVRRDGAHLFPVFPYTHFTTVNDADLTALYAFLMTQPPVIAPARDNTVPFPLNVRAFQAIWKQLYFVEGPLPTNAAKSLDWNRGRYLAEGLAHCASCHTPRNTLGAERPYAAYFGADIDGWYAPALTSANTAPLPWTEAELFVYLRNGATALHGVAVGPMSQVVHEGLAQSSDADLHALATYYADLNASATAAVNTDEVLAGVMQKSAQSSGLQNDRGATLYLAACASCHANIAGSPALLRPELGLNSALTAAEPTNFIWVILRGVGRDEGIPSVIMPGFAEALSDTEVAELSAYLRRRTALPAWKNLDASIALARKSSALNGPISHFVK